MSEYTPWTHRVAYFETDQMGIVHHSNYIRWFEEARDDVARQMGMDSRLVEAEGIEMPVTFVRCTYRSQARYAERVEVCCHPFYFTGVRLHYDYEARSLDTGALLAHGETGHCFIDRVTRQPLNLKRRMPDYCARITELKENGRMWKAYGEFTI